MALTQKFLQDIKKSFKYAHWYMKSFLISPDTPWNSTTVIKLVYRSKKSHRIQFLGFEIQLWSFRATRTKKPFKIMVFWWILSFFESSSCNFDNGHCCGLDVNTDYCKLCLHCKYETVTILVFSGLSVPADSSCHFSY